MPNHRSYGTICPVSTRQNQKLILEVFIVGVGLLLTIILCYLILIQKRLTSHYPVRDYNYQTTISPRSAEKIILTPPNQQVASWYNYDLPNYPNYSKQNLTAASRDYPRGTKPIVCRVNDSIFPPRCVVVRVNDYGPEHCEDNPIACPERDIDLSSKAFKELQDLKLGLLKVTITPL